MAAVAQIQPLAWEFPQASGAALKNQKKKKKKKKTKKKEKEKEEYVRLFFLSIACQ